MKAEYQVIARKFRPRLFREVVGQEAIVTTLINAIKQKRVAHAYLFCGTRGTGKTTLARLFAKALNCKDLSSEIEPCNACSSCKEIDAFSAIDVIEIDGASHRGIEDVRAINETIVYAPSHGRYKIYIIDEVHMLTKEAFNALLKSLEEPPERVKFFFATTEAHKIPGTILSRCQRFNLNRISAQKMGEKLSKIALDLNVEIEAAALGLIAELSGGSLRDAESLFDQLISYYGNKITSSGVSELLGLLPKERFEELDKAVSQQTFSVAFRLADEVFSSGRNVEYFIEELIGHYRATLFKKSEIYTQEQCLDILEWLSTLAHEIKFAFSQRTQLEMVLMRIIRSQKKPQLEMLIARLLDLESRMGKEAPPQQLPPQVPVKEAAPQAPQTLGVKEKSRFDTVMRFAAKELGGSLKKE